MQIDYSDEHKKRLSLFMGDSRFDLFVKQHNPARVHICQQLAHSFAEHGMDEIRGHIRQRDENEGAFVQAFVRDDERRRIEHEVIIEQDVEIDQPRPPAESRLASDLDFELFQPRQQLSRDERRPRVDSHIKKRGLIGKSPGRRLIDSRNGDLLNIGMKRAESRAQVGESVTEVGPEGEENVMFHVVANIS